MQIYFWQNILSPHQAPLMQQLAYLGHDVIIVCPELISSHRLALGWTVPVVSNANLIVGPSLDEVEQIIINSPAESIHIIAGARTIPLGKFVTRLCIQQNRRIGILSEAPDMRGVAYAFRLAKYTLERIRFGRRYDFILGMGDLGVKWFRKCGYERHIIFPFFYTVETKLKDSQTITDVDGEIRLMFVGRLVNLKGVDLLIKTLATLKSSQKWVLTIIGDGPERASLEILAEKYGIADRLIWNGQMDSDAVYAAVRQADLLIVPSRKDGWAAVVSESLMLGTPVLCSSACGASAIIVEPFLGAKFSISDRKQLQQLLQVRIEKGHNTDNERSEIVSWSKRITGEAASAYLVEIFEYIYQGAERPIPPYMHSTRS